MSPLNVEREDGLSFDVKNTNSGSFNVGDKSIGLEGEKKGGVVKIPGVLQFQGKSDVSGIIHLKKGKMKIGEYTITPTDEE